MDSEDAMQAALDGEAAKRAEHATRKFNWLNAENTRRRISGMPLLGSDSPEVIERWRTMDLMAGYGPEIEVTPESAPELPGMPEEKITSLQFDMYEMVANLLNRLELLGENLLADYDETGNTQLGGESHTLVFSMESLMWEIKEGRTGSK